MQAGKLRHRAELQRQDETSDGAGGVTLAWVKERDIWCHIRSISGVQKMESMRRESSISHEITVRYADDVDTTKRLVYNGKAFNLEAVWDPDEIGERLEIIASTGVPT